MLRFVNFYGPDSAFTRAMIQPARRGWLPIFGPPDGVFSLLSHDDAAATVAALNVSAGVYNVAAQAVGAGWLAASNTPAPRLPPRWAEKLTGSMGEAMARSLSKAPIK